jgi:hypothetical protein
MATTKKTALKKKADPLQDKLLEVQAREAVRCAHLNEVVRRLRLAIDDTVADPTQVTQFTELVNEVERLANDQ